MDLGEMPTGIESPLIPVLLWAALAALVAVTVVVTVVAARRKGHSRSVLIIGGVLVLLGVAAGLTIWSRYGLATAIDSGLCPATPDGVSYLGFYTLVNGPDPMDVYQQCLTLQYRLVAGVLGGYAVAVTAGSLVQLRASRIRSA